MSVSNDECPDPMADPDGYALWCELHACRTCEGTGDGEQDDNGLEHECRACGGTGIDPEYENVGSPDEWEGDW